MTVPHDSILPIYQQHPKTVRYLAFISGLCQNTGPINLTDPLSSQSLPAWFQHLVCAPNPGGKIRESNQLVLKMCLATAVAYSHV